MARKFNDKEIKMAIKKAEKAEKSVSLLTSSPAIRGDKERNITSERCEAGIRSIINELKTFL